MSAAESVPGLVVSDARGGTVLEVTPAGRLTLTVETVDGQRIDLTTEHEGRDLTPEEVESTAEGFATLAARVTEARRERERQAIRARLEGLTSKVAATLGPLLAFAESEDALERARATAVALEQDAAEARRHLEAVMPYLRSDRSFGEAEHADEAREFLARSVPSTEDPAPTEESTTDAEPTPEHGDPAG